MLRSLNNSLKHKMLKMVNYGQFDRWTNDYRVASKLKTMYKALWFDIVLKNNLVFVAKNILPTYCISLILSFNLFTLI